VFIYNFAPGTSADTVNHKMHQVFTLTLSTIKKASSVR